MQIPLAQSAPMEQLVFGRDPLDSHSPPVHLPLTQSLACEHVEPGSELPEDGLPDGLPDRPAWHTPAVQT